MVTRRQGEALRGSGPSSNAGIFELYRQRAEKPPLPDLEFAIFEKPQPGPATAALSAALTLLAHASDRPQASISLASAPDGERTGE
jgi:hypothetical protein